MLRLDNGESGELVQALTSQTLAYIGAATAATSSPTYSSNNVVVNGTSLTTAIGAMDAAATFRSADEVITGQWSFTDDIYLSALKKLYVDGGSNSFIYEAAADDVRIAAGGNENLRVTTNFVGVRSTADFYVDATKKIFYDGGADTYDYEVSANLIQHVAGATTSFWHDASGIKIPNNYKIRQNDSGGTDRNLIGMDSSDIVRVYNNSVGASVRVQISASDLLEIASTGVYAISTDFALTATQKLRFNGTGGNDYIYASSAAVIDIVRAGSLTFRVGSNTFLFGSDFVINTAQKIRYDGSAAGDTYEYEVSANLLQRVVGGSTSFWSQANGIKVPNNGAFQTNDSGGTERNILQLDASDILRAQNNSAAAEFRVQCAAVDALRVTAAFVGVRSSTDFYIESTRKAYWDGGGDSYRTESSANVIDDYAGGTKATTFTSTYFQINSGIQLRHQGSTYTWDTDGSINVKDITLAGTAFEWSSSGDIGARTQVLSWAANAGADTSMLAISGSNAGAGNMYAINLNTIGGTLDGFIKTDSTYVSTAAAGAYYGKILVNVDGVGDKYLHLFGP